MGISVSTYDTPLTSALQAAESLIRQKTCRPLGFTSQAITEYLDGEHFNRLVLKYTPVDTGETITVSVEGTTVASTDYTIDANVGIIGFKDTALTGWYAGRSINHTLPQITSHPVPNFGGGFRQVTVTYTGGYEAADMPEALKTAANMLAASLFQQRQGIALQSQTLGQHSWTRATSGEIWDQINPLIKEFTSCARL
jgi:hypothetical protein